MVPTAKERLSLTILTGKFYVIKSLEAPVTMKGIANLFPYFHFHSPPEYGRKPVSNLQIYMASPCTSSLEIYFPTGPSSQD